MSDFLDVTVQAVNEITPVIREFTLVSNTSRLPLYSAGSHIQVHIPLAHRALRNAYSLIGSPINCESYRIAVRLQSSSRGGSAFMHEQIRAGDRLRITRPANLFPIHSQGRHHILIAGGIGITPFMAYIEHLLSEQASFELHYAYRSGLTDAYAAFLEKRIGDRLHRYDSLERPLNLNSVLRTQPLGSHVYVCGPERLLESVQEQARNIGWPSGRIHWERFTSAEPGKPFSVRLQRSDRNLEVQGDESLLEALEATALNIPNMCRGGVCGQCMTYYVEGEVEHRDHFLAPQERSHCLMPCVSRGCGSTLVLDL